MGDSSQQDTAGVNEEVKHHWSKKDIALSVAALVITIFLCVAAIYYKDYFLDMSHLTHYGLLGVLIVTFVASSTLSATAIPVPYWLLVFTLPSVLATRWGIGSPVLVAVVSGFGASLGQLITFLIGRGGRGFSQKLVSKVNGGWYARAVGMAQQHGSLVVFVMSAVPNPLHVPLTLAIAALHFPAWEFFLFSLLGNVIKSAVIAFCGYFGLTSLFHFLGV